jgi:hypothetical protein
VTRTLPEQEVSHVKNRNSIQIFETKCYLFIHSFILLLYMRGDPSKGCDSSVEGAPGMRGHQVGVAVVAVAGLFMWSHYFVL